LITTGMASSSVDFRFEQHGRHGRDESLPARPFAVPVSGFANH
jgi:hypothetical protein